MIKSFFTKEKPRLYLDSVMVIPRSEWKSFDEWNWVNRKEDFEQSARQKLETLFNFPHVSTAENIGKKDVALEVALLKIQGGEFAALDFGVGAIPIFWRPKVTLKARLYGIKSGKTVSTFSVTEKVSWKYYLLRVFSLRGVFRYKPLFDQEDINMLLHKACTVLITQMSKKL
jgi:hypothetical protein